jgi:hypothetical protein
MNGWPACEVGHVHFEHPHRTAEQFDANLDNFSSLVIYLTLLSLAERPSLWEEYHDENLLFTKGDFVDPSSSSLFAKIREIGTEHARLADVLANAAAEPPAATPRLSDLVNAPSRLPSWMTAPVDLETAPKTREVERTDALTGNRNVRWLPWIERQKETPLPSTPSSSTVQSIFNAGSVPPAAVARDPDKIAANTLYFAKDFFRGHFFWWYWGVYVLFQFGGLSSGASFLAAIVCVTIACLTYGLYRAIEEQRNARRSGPSSQRTASLPHGLPRQSPLAWQTITLQPRPLPGFSAGSSTITQQPARIITQPPLPPITQSSEPFIGNRVLGIYHLRDCDWVEQISTANIVSFASVSEAASHGYKPCRICSPAS